MEGKPLENQIHELQPKAMMPGFQQGISFVVFFIIC